MKLTKISWGKKKTTNDTKQINVNVNKTEWQLCKRHYGNFKGIKHFKMSRRITCVE